MPTQPKVPEPTSGAKLPYVVQPTMLPKIFGKIKEAKAPDRFTVDFLQTKLGFNGGNYRQFIPLAKKLGRLAPDGSPSDRYRKLRNPSTSKLAMGEAIRTGYRELFERNEYAQSLKRDELKGLVLEITGLEADSDVVQRVCQTFEALKGQAEFDEAANESRAESEEGPVADKGVGESGVKEAEHHNFRLGLSYTINLVLPKTDDPAVFNAIFRSLRDNLLRS